LGGLFIVVVLAFPNGLAGIWRDHIQSRVERIMGPRKSGKGWSQPAIADKSPAE
jgi:urea transport system permease protein